MNKYTIPCTEEQTKKALELGAPILKNPQPIYGSPIIIDTNIQLITIDNKLYIIPTAEQMIGWLEERGIFISINHIGAGYSSWLKTISTNENISENLGYVSTRKEATLAAIDAALEYLSNNKKTYRI